ncbi:MAG: ATP-binding protein, partial [Actinomycetota bacterium]
GEINVALDLDDERSLTATVTDSGAWRNGGASGRGYGLQIMHALMDEVIIEPGDRGSVVTLRKTVERDGSRRPDDPTTTSR